MSSRKFKEEHQDCLCYICDKVKPENEINKLKMRGRSIGSEFDGSKFTMNICDSCIKIEHYKWFLEEPKLVDKYTEKYEHESKIKELIDSLLIENQEYIMNGFMSREDWIAMKKGTLPDKEYKKYFMYSPSEARAYKERFPTCEHPVNVRYSENSVGCKCSVGAMGHKNQEASVNISEKCFECSFYKKRETPIKEIKKEDLEDYDLFKLYQLRENELLNKFEDKKPKNKD